MLPWRRLSTRAAEARELRRIAVEVDDDVSRLFGDRIARRGRRSDAGARVGVGAELRASGGEGVRDLDGALDAAGGAPMRVTGATGVAAGLPSEDAPSSFVAAVTTETKATSAIRVAAGIRRERKTSKLTEVVGDL